MAADDARDHREEHELAGDDVAAERRAERGDERGADGGELRARARERERLVGGARRRQQRVARPLELPVDEAVEARLRRRRPQRALLRDERGDRGGDVGAPSRRRCRAHVAIASAASWLAATPSRRHTSTTSFTRERRGSRRLAADPVADTVALAGG